MGACCSKVEKTLSDEAKAFILAEITAVRKELFEQLAALATDQLKDPPPQAAGAPVRFHSQI